MRIIDAKALYDHLSRETNGPSQDKRTGLEIQVVRQHMNAMAAEVRWVPHPQMSVDGLRKKGANMRALYDLLETGEFQIADVAEAPEKKVNEALRRRTGVDDATSKKIRSCGNLWIWLFSIVSCEAS